MKKFFFGIFVFAIFFHIFFYISALRTNTLEVLYDSTRPGQDFFQIPNAARAFLQGGDLKGEMPDGSKNPYTNCCGVNTNVYHPFFTLLIGLPLQLFSPWTAYYVWEAIHALTTIFLIIFIYTRFKHNKYLYLGLFLFLLHAFHYYEIRNAQFHFLFNFFSFFLIYESVKKGDSVKAGIFLFLSLLVKPIGLLWIIPLLIYRHYKTVFVGLLFFLAVSAPFYMFEIGRYYFSNFLYVSTASIPSDNLLNFVWFFPQHQIIIEKVVKYFMYATFLFFLYLQIYKKPSLFTLFFLWTSFQLLFYNLVFHYQFTVLGLLFCLGILLKDIKIRKMELIPIIFLTIPSPFFLYNIGISSNIGLLFNEATWSLWSDFWLIFLITVISIRIVKEKTNYV
jgi:hypothetical protein